MKRLALFVICLLVGACAPLPSTLPHPQPTQDELLQRLDATRAAFFSLKGLAKASYRRGEESMTASQVVIARSPDKLRLEILGLFGSPVMILATDGAALTVLLPGEAKAFQGAATSGFLQQVLRLPLQQTDLVSLLLQQPLLLPWETTEVVYESDGRSRLMLENAYGLVQNLTFDRHLHLVACEYRLAGIRQMLVSYANFDDVHNFPHNIQLSLPPDDIDMTLDFSSAELNADLLASRFVLVPPAGYTIEPLPGRP